MNEQLIANLLAQVEQEFEVILQVIVQEPYLYVFINRPSDSHLDYFDLTQRIYHILLQEQIPTVTGVSFHSRISGTVTSDWETYLELPSLQEISYPLSSEETHETQLNKTSEALAEEESLISHHPENLPTELINSSSEITSHLESEETPENYSFNLSAYCFIRNKGLLTSKILHPSTSIATIIQNLHQLSNTEQQQFLSSLKYWVENSQLPNLEEVSEDVKKELETITQFDGETQRKALIWLSRYCLNPEETLSHVKATLAKHTETVSKTESSSPETAQEAVTETPSSTNHCQQSYTYKQSSTQKTINTPQTNPNLPSKTKIPLSWIAILTVFLFMVIGTTFHSNKAAALCSDSTSKYCDLAVKIASVSTLETASQNPIIISPSLEEIFKETCINRANLQAGIDLQTVIQEKPVLPQSLSGEQILPGIYVADITQSNFKTGSSSLRIACVVTAKESIQEIDQTAINVLGIDVIPDNWPTKPYKRKPTSMAAFEDSLGVFGLFMMLGTGTLFTTIGIILAAIANLGIRIDTVKTAFKAAFFFGIIESIIMSFWHILFPFSPGILASIPLENTVLLVTSGLVKDFNIDWTLGFRIIGIGTAIIIGTRMILNFLLLLLISSII